MSRPRRRIRRNTKALDWMKAGAVLLCLLLGTLLILWIGMQLVREAAPEPDRTPKPGQSMWETPPSGR
ncbi:MAG: hypothetical protein ABIP20_07780 [Chthoniobacteraceae bacterium]